MATYFVSDATGSDSDDGLSAGDAWLTIDKAMNEVAAGDKVWVKADGTYSESPDIVTGGTTNSEIVFEGYTTSTGDGGRATIQGTLTDTTNTRIMYCFKNFIIDANGNDHAVELASYEITWRNCIFKNGASNGLEQRRTSATGAAACFYSCEFLDNSGNGAEVGGTAFFMNCKFYRNGVSGIDCAGTVICYCCTFFSNAGLNIDGGAANETAVIVLNCTIDGDSKDSNEGVTNNAAFRGFMVVANTIVYDCSTGIDSNHGDRDVLVYNLLNSNTADYGGDATGQEGEVTGAPDFVNEAAGADYTPNPASPAVGAGTDFSADEMDMGAIQLALAGGGGGLLGPNKNAGRQQ